MIRSFAPSIACHAFIVFLFSYTHIVLPQTYCSETETAPRPQLENFYDTEHFRIHYEQSGTHATTIKYVENVAEALEKSWQLEIIEQGWHQPPFDCGEGGDSRFDVYLLDLIPESQSEIITGYTQRDRVIGDNLHTPHIAEQSAAYSHLVIENDFAEVPHIDSLILLQTTIAHEFHHAVQMGYATSQSFMGLDEADAVWIEVQTYLEYSDLIIDNTEIFLQHPNICIGNMEVDGRIYGEWLLMEMLSQQYGIEAIQTIWEFRIWQDGLEAFYSTLESLGTTPQEFMKIVAIENLLSNKEDLYIEASLTTTGDIIPTHAGVQELAVDYIHIATPNTYQFSLTADPSLELIFVGINKTSVDSQTLADNQIIDSQAYEDAYLLIFNPYQHESSQNCTAINWILSVETP